MIINLWNETEKKTHKVQEYIKSLIPDERWGTKATQRFKETIKEALQEIQANKMLEKVGYSFKRTPTIYKRCWEIDVIEQKEREKQNKPKTEEK
jgi:uncharacterized membrane-anchored protein